jgi:hypothetical protein
VKREDAPPAEEPDEDDSHLIEDDDAERERKQKLEQRLAELREAE